MSYSSAVDVTVKSPSPRRAWIEIPPAGLEFIEYLSPSPRRAWIEIYRLRKDKIFGEVALPTEGVD